jgi:hypothetical protein
MELIHPNLYERLVNPAFFLLVDNILAGIWNELCINSISIYFKRIGAKDE